MDIFIIWLRKLYGWLLIAEALASITFAIVIYQDFKERMVSDLAWIPAVVSLPVLFYESANDWRLTVFKLIVVAIVAGVSWLIGAFGQADSIALAFMGISTYALSPLPQFILMSVAALVHISWLMIKNRSFRIERTMSVEQALEQSVWIPKRLRFEDKEIQLSTNPEEAWQALDEYKGKKGEVIATYGVPLAAYMGIGYILAFIMSIASQLTFHL